MIRSFQYKGSSLILASVLFACSSPAPNWENVSEEGSFLMYRRQSLIGEESFSIISDRDSIVIRSLQGENERGRIRGVQAELRLGIDLSPAYYRNRRIAGSDTTNVLEVVASSQEVSIQEKDAGIVTATKWAAFFPVHSNIPAAMEMMLYHYYLERGLRSEEHTLNSSHVVTSYAVFCLKNKTPPPPPPRIL